MCQHDKIYNKDIYLASFPPKYIWKCSKCGAEGYDVKNDLAKTEFIEWNKNNVFFKS